jgi:hypothetical protein
MANAIPFQIIYTGILRCQCPACRADAATQMVIEAGSTRRDWFHISWDKEDGLKKSFDLVHTV